jgi:hypothetical protein
MRRENGQEIVLPFSYGAAKDGASLGQNIVLKAGDTIVVP